MEVGKFHRTDFNFASAEERNQYLKDVKEHTDQVVRDRVELGRTAMMPYASAADQDVPEVPQTPNAHWADMPA